MLNPGIHCRLLAGARLRALRTLIAAVSFLALVLAPGLAAQDDREVKLKAAYLINLTGFVRWPEDRAETRICIPPESRIAPYVIAQSGRKLGGDRILATRTAWDDLGDCDMLYWDRLDTPWDSGESVLGSFPGLLTISDQKGALDQGYAIQFYTRNLKLRFAVNTELLRGADFSISSKLLRLSRQVD